MRTHPKLDHSDCCAYAAPPNPNSAVVLQKGTLKENKLAGNLAYSITFNPQSARELKWSLLNWKGGGSIEMGFPAPKSEHYTSGSQQDGSNATGFFTSCTLPIAIETPVV